MSVLHEVPTCMLGIGPAVRVASGTLQGDSINLSFVPTPIGFFPFKSFKFRLKVTLFSCENVDKLIQLYTHLHQQMHIHQSSSITLKSCCNPSGHLLLLLVATDRSL